MAALSGAGHDVALVAALARNRAIGRDNALPWHLPEDLRRFRRLTMGRAVLMGRRTHESIGRALPGRENLVLTRSAGYRAPGCRVFTELGAALEHAAPGPVMVIGGAEIYAQTIAIAAAMYLTLVDAQVHADAWFPSFDAADWEVCREEEHPVTDERPLGFRFVDYRRRDQRR